MSKADAKKHLQRLLGGRGESEAMKFNQARNGYNFTTLRIFSALNKVTP